MTSSLKVVLRAQAVGRGYQGSAGGFRGKDGGYQGRGGGRKGYKGGSGGYQQRGANMRNDGKAENHHVKFADQGHAGLVLDYDLDLDLERYHPHRRSYAFMVLEREAAKLSVYLVT